VKHMNEGLDMSAAQVSPGPPLSAHDKRILEAVHSAVSGWLEEMEAMRRMEEDFAACLVRCRTAREAIGLSTEWMAKRLDSLIAVQHHLVELWLECEAAQSPVVADWERPVRKRRGR